MSLLLSPLRQTFNVLRKSETILGIRNISPNSSWMGRAVSTRPPGCSEKCAKFNPKKSCCRTDDDIDWHPHNIYHSNKARFEMSSESQDSSSQTTEVDHDSGSEVDSGTDD